jgi:GNAT superfamily N-acetyltransferase
MSSETGYPLITGIHPLTAERWPDFEELFGAHGGTSGCWCMWWRLSRREFKERLGEGNRLAMKAIVESGEIPGILCYRGGKAVGWCSVAPRERFASLERSPVLRKRDNAAVWSIVCFFVAKGSRGQGVAEELIHGAVEYVKGKGGKVVEAYPTLPKRGGAAPAAIYMGVPAIFEKAGFTECARPSGSRVIMRRYID